MPTALPAAMLVALDHRTTCLLSQVARGVAMLAGLHTPLACSAHRILTILPSADVLGCARACNALTCISCPTQHSITADSCTCTPSMEGISRQRINSKVQLAVHPAGQLRGNGGQQHICQHLPAAASCCLLCITLHSVIHQEIADLDEIKMKAHSTQEQASVVTILPLGFHAVFGQRRLDVPTFFPSKERGFHGWPQAMA